MARSAAKTVDEYLNELPEERRQVVSAVREVILRNLPEGYREEISFGMIGYVVPLERYPVTYNGQPLAYAGLAAQKSHYAVYLTAIYQDAKREARLREDFAQAGKRLDMGKSCLRFRKLTDLPLDVIGRTIASVPPEAFIASYEAVKVK